MTVIPAHPNETEPESDHGHDPHLAHHWDTPRQQFEAAKFGMWLFLATEVLLFGGLFCVYAIFRTLHPELFAYGSQFLDTTWGAVNTVVLILSSLTMAVAVWCAQCNHRRHLIFFLLLTLLLAGDFLLIKYLEYSHKIHDHLVWGTQLYEPPRHAVRPVDETEEAAETPAAGAPATAVAAATATAPSGRDLWMATCRACHGVQGEGIPGQGKDIRGSEFIVSRDDQELVDFIKVGRMPFDPLNTTGIQMPPRGGNPMLKDGDLLTIVGYLRTIMGTEGGPGPAEGAAPVAGEEFYVPVSVLPPPPPGPAGLDPVALLALEGEPPAPPPPGPPVHPAYDPDRPVNAHMFFAIYFCMTGLHGLHVFAGMVVIAWLLIGAWRRKFGSAYFTPVDLGGLYWHVVDVIWIFLFPLFYLIG